MHTVGDATGSATTDSAEQPSEEQPKNRQPSELQDRAAETAAKLQLVVKHVGAAYKYYRSDLFTSKEPQLEEARKVALYVAKRQTGSLSAQQLAANPRMHLRPSKARSKRSNLSSS